MPDAGDSDNGAPAAADLGLIGLGVMGRALAGNLAERGFRVVGWDAAAEARAAAASDLTVAESAADLVHRLAPPRAVLVMVPAGPAVDAVLATLAPLLQAGDVVADGGNSRHQDSRRRAGEAAASGLGYLGLGISGGEAGARHGPSIMAGGDAAAYARLAPLLETVAARVDGRPCVALLGPDGAGHFVKTLHNGIEYAVMQAIAEAGYLLRRLGGLSPAAAAEVFAGWNKGALQSYLIAITAEVLAARDGAGGPPLVDMIRDRAGEKGTGRWAAIAAMELGIAAPGLAEAVLARAATAGPRASEGAAPPGTLDLAPGGVRGLADELEAALLAAILCCYVQGFEVLAAAGREHGWALPLAEIARIWQGGCIIRARLLADLARALEPAGAPAALLDDPALARQLAGGIAAWRRVVLVATARGLPVPVLSANLAWLDARHQPRLWADLIQAQRDYFGRHGFERVDRPGLHHHDWTEEPET